MREALKKKEITDNLKQQVASPPKVEIFRASELEAQKAYSGKSPRVKGISKSNLHMLKPPKASNQSVVRKPAIQDETKETQRPLELVKKKPAQPAEKAIPDKRVQKVVSEQRVGKAVLKEETLQEHVLEETPVQKEKKAQPEVCPEPPASPSSKEEPVLEAEEPGEIISKVTSTPPSKIIGIYNQGIGLAEKVLTSQAEKTQKDLPEIAVPTGLPAKQAHSQKKYKAKISKAPETLKGLKQEKISGTDPELFKEDEFEVSQGYEKEDLKSLGKSPNQHIENISLDTHKLPSRIVSRPKLDLVGQSNPDQMNAFKNDASTHVRQAEQEALKEAAQDFGENNIYPDKSPGRIKSSRQIDMSAKKAGVAIQTPDIPAEAVKGIDQEMGAVLKTGFEKEQMRYAAAHKKCEKQTQNSRETANSKIDGLTEETKEIQQKERAKVSTTVSGYKKEWQDKIKHVHKDFDNKSQKATLEQQAKIETEKNKGEKEADKHLNKAEQEAFIARKKAEKDVETLKKEKKKEAGGIIDWVVSKLSSFIDALKQAVSSVFDWLKKKVKQIFEAAKKLAMKAIESARKAITRFIKELGQVLKKFVSIAFAAFPDIAKAINSKIDAACHAAVQKVNQAAELLKKSVAKVLNFLSDVLIKALDVVHSVFSFAFTAVGMLIRGEFSKLGTYIFKSIVKLVGSSIKFLMTAMGISTEAMDKIIDDPAKFFKNLGKAIKKGIGDFLANIWTHLKSGLLSWLFGVFDGIQIEFPKTLNLKGIFHVLAQILGLTWTSVRAQLVKRLGPKGESLISKAEVSVEVVKELMIQGPSAMWERVKQGVGDLKRLFFETLIDWLKTTIVFKAFELILSFINPVGAIFQAIKAIYNIVMFFHENWQRIKDFVRTVYKSLTDVLAEKVSTAASYITSSMVQAVPIVLGFLARLLGLHNIVEPVRKVIRKVSKPINKARKKVVGFVAQKVKTLMKKVGKAFKKTGKKAEKTVEKVVKKVLRWWKKRKKFKANDGNMHELFFKGRDKTAKLMIASKTTLFKDFINELVIPPSKDKSSKKVKADKEKAVAFAKDVDKARAAEVKGATDAEKEENHKKKTTRINNLLEDLRKSTIGLFGIIEESKNPDYKPGTPFAKQTIIEKLTKIPPPEGEGTTPTQKKHKVYDTLDYRRKGDKSASYYIRGHLLNHNLYGRGEWYNMTPLSREGNSNHEKEVESKVKAAVRSGATLFYSVTPKYGNQPNKTALIKEIEEKDGLPDRKLKQNIVEAEDHVPINLKCEAKTVGTGKAKWELTKTVTNPIGREYHDYQLRGDRAYPIVVKMNSCLERHYVTLPGIGPKLAKKIIDLRNKRQKDDQKKKVFSKHEDLTQITGIGDEKVANMKNYEKTIKEDFGIKCIDFDN